MQRSLSVCYCFICNFSLESYKTILSFVLLQTPMDSNTGNKWKDVLKHGSTPSAPATPNGHLVQRDSLVTRLNFQDVTDDIKISQTDTKITSSDDGKLKVNRYAMIQQVQFQSNF